MNTEKVAKSAAKKAGRGFMTFLEGVGTVLEASAEASNRRAESKAEIVKAIEEHNDSFGSYPQYRLVLITKQDLDLLKRAAEETVHSTPAKPRRCTVNTSFWDCEDPNCHWHQSEKDERQIGTPTRNFR